MQVDLREFRAAYLAEVDEHLGSINALLLAVEVASRAGKPSPRDLRELMRLLHTIKGLLGMVGVEPIVTVAHRMETVLRAADRAGGLLGDRALEALLGGTRAIEARVRAHLKGREVWVQDAFAGHDPAHRLPIRVVCERAYHALFAHQLFVRPSPAERAVHRPEFTVIAVPDFLAVPGRDGTRSEVFILLHLGRGELVFRSAGPTRRLGVACLGKPAHCAGKAVESPGA